jgi:glycosyltransferase involved in cell wall biosynthesis
MLIGIQAVIVVPDIPDSRTMFPSSEFNVRYVSLQRIRKSFNPLKQFRFLISSISLVNKIRHMIVQESVDIVHFNEALDFVAGFSALLTRKPCVCHIRADENFFFRGLLIIIKRLVDAIIVPSIYTENWISRNGKSLKKRTFRIYDFAFDVAQYNEPTSGKLIRQELNIPDHAPLILFASKLYKIKGHLDFIRAANLVHTEFPEAVFLIVGGVVDGHENEAQEIRNFGKKQSLGNSLLIWNARKDIASVFAAADIFVHCPIYPDTYPTVVLLSMLLGKPTIGTNIGGIPEQITNGVTGILVPPCNAHELANAILELLRNPSRMKELGESAKAQMRSAISHENQARQILAVYDRVMQNKKVNQESLLCIATFPPPMTGSAYVSQTVLDHFKEQYATSTANYQKGSLFSGSFSIIHSLRVVFISMKFLLMHKSFHRVYLVISSSFLGNIRDLLFLISLGPAMRKRTIIHLHGGNFQQMLEKKAGIYKWINKIIFKDIRAAIVLGKAQSNHLNGYVPKEKTYFVHNFFDNSLLIEKESLEVNFNSPKKIKIIFLSNMIRSKGYQELLAAFLLLPEKNRNKAELHFAGHFSSYKDELSFKKSIENHLNIFFHGSVAGAEKKNLFLSAHIFCLPTYYPPEGQPISILEAYAAGCIVLTTPHNGIVDIFNDTRNGFFVGGKNYDTNKLTHDLMEKLSLVINDITSFKEMAMQNREEAITKYSKDLFLSNMENVFEGKAQPISC